MNRLAREVIMNSDEEEEKAWNEVHLADLRRDEAEIDERAQAFEAFYRRLVLEVFAFQTKRAGSSERLAVGEDRYIIEEMIALDLMWRGILADMKTLCHLPSYKNFLTLEEMEVGWVYMESDEKAAEIAAFITKRDALQDKMRAAFVVPPLLDMRYPSELTPITSHILDLIWKMQFHVDSAERGRAETAGEKFFWHFRSLPDCVPLLKEIKAAVDELWGDEIEVLVPSGETVIDLVEALGLANR